MANTENTNYITVEMFNAGIERIEQKLDKLEKTTTELKTEIRLNASDIAHLQTSVYWGFAIMGIVFAIVSISVAIIALFKGEKTEKKQSLSEHEVTEVRTLIRDEFARLTVR